MNEKKNSTVSVVRNPENEIVWAAPGSWEAERWEQHGASQSDWALDEGGSLTLAEGFRLAPRYEFTCAVGVDSQTHWEVRHRDGGALLVGGSSCSPGDAWSEACEQAKERS